MKIRASKGSIAFAGKYERQAPLFISSRKVYRATVTPASFILEPKAQPLDLTANMLSLPTARQRDSHLTEKRVKESFE
jgi:hypothetical protein